MNLVDIKIFFVFILFIGFSDDEAIPRTEPFIQGQLMHSSTYETPFSYFSERLDSSHTVMINTYVPDLTGRNKMKEIYQPAQFTILKKEQPQSNFEVQVRTRGNVRKEVCDFPPLKIKFDKSTLSEHGWIANDKLKFVFPCDWSDDNQQRLLKEYAIYQMYEIIGEYYLETKLVHFQIAQSKNILYDFVGFMIEEEEDFTARTRIPLIDEGKIRSSRIDRKSLLKMLLFQYMILNTDLGIDSRHNLEIAYDEHSKSYIPIPYDFDYAGLVDQPYAIPNKGLGIKKVTQPLFLMKGVKKEELREMVEFYQLRETDIKQLINSIPFFEKKVIEEMEERINDFYKILANESLWKGELIK